MLKNLLGVRTLLAVNLDFWNQNQIKMLYYAVNYVRVSLKMKYTTVIIK